MPEKKTSFNVAAANARIKKLTKELTSARQKLRNALKRIIKNDALWKTKVEKAKKEAYEKAVVALEKVIQKRDEVRKRFLASAEMKFAKEFIKKQKKKIVAKKKVAKKPAAKKRVVKKPVTKKKIAKKPVAKKRVTKKLPATKQK